MAEALDGRAFEFAIEITASAEEVWKAWTDAKELTRWFPLEARVTPGVGGSVFLSWGPPYEGTAPITVWDPPKRLQWVESVSPGGDPSRAAVPIAVEFQIEGRGGSSVLRLVHSGFDASGDWKDYYDSISSGWKFELRGLKHYLEHHRGRDREVVWVRKKMRGTTEEIARRLVGAEGSVLRGDVRRLGEDERYALEVVGGGGMELKGRVRVNGRPRSFCATVENLNNSYLRFEVEGSKEEKEVWLWLSTYGVEEETRRRLEECWRRAIDA